MKTKWILSVIGAMAFSQIVGAQGLVTGLSSDESLGNVLTGDVQVVNVSADAARARNYSTKTKSNWDASSSDSSDDVAADGGWLNFGIAAAPDLFAVDNNNDDIASFMPTEAVADVQAPQISVEVGAAGVGAAAHTPLAAIPEPSTFGLLMFGGSAFIRFFRRK